MFKEIKRFASNPWFIVALRVGILLGFVSKWLVAAAFADEQGRLLSTEGRVEFGRQKSEWSPAVVNQQLQSQDRVRTLALSRAMVQLAELGRLRLDELTTLEILPPRSPGSKGTLDLKAGAIYFFTRDRPREFDIQTPQALAASRGTEFLVSIEPAGREVFLVYDGEVELSNSLGRVLVTKGEQGVVEPGQPPRKTAVIQGTRIVQWWLYYAAVLDPDELSFNLNQQQALAKSLAAYRQGSLLQALKDYPGGRAPENNDEQVFLAALLLSVGQVENAERLLSRTNSVSSLARAVRVTIDTVQNRDVEPVAHPRTATEWLADSYQQQYRFNLAAALASARKATEQSPSFGFAWARVAELEFSFGHTVDASAALDKSLALSPLNAQAWVMKGFLLCQQLQWNAARQAFERAVALDPGLGNAWLGRGLVKIRLGNPTEGREDLQTAAAMEPNRSLLRSYLGKAFDYTDDQVNANRELALAKQLDAADPTPWLYSALILRQQFRYNEAVAELERSVALNKDRQVYRSRLLLDEDQAVRGASLATVYRAAGMDEVSVREAALAVTYDYGNFSAHEFLAQSFDALRDPTDFNLRYDTVWLNESLLANLLAPVGAGTLSRNVTPQEYSRLFTANELGLTSSTEYRTDGQFHQQATQYGTVGRLSYSLDLDYRHYDGTRPNNYLSRIEWFSQIKYQLTPKDSIFLLAEYRDYSSGDNFLYYNPSQASPHYSYTESQTPNILGAYHHEWSPGVHTLALGGRLENHQQFSDKSVNALVLQTNGAGHVTGDFPVGLDPATGSDNGGVDVADSVDFDIYTAELNQIFQDDIQTLVFGARLQGGQFTTHNVISNVQPSYLAPFFSDPPVDATENNNYDRASVYGYYTLEPVERLWLTAGLAYDYLNYPANFRSPPVSSGNDTRYHLGPKAALVWSPLPEATLRGIYSSSLGGVSYENSYRLEPAQLAGFVQSYGSIIPESVVGSLSAPTYDVYGVALDLKFKTRTYVGVQAQYLTAAVQDQIGVFNFPDAVPPSPMSAVPSSTPRQLEFYEPSLAITANQLVGNCWSLGAQYQIAQAKLETAYPQIQPVDPAANSTVSATLQQARLFVVFNHPSGFFSRLESLWFNQYNYDYSPSLPGDDFFQENILVGYRFRHQYGEISFGVLNLSNTDYHLNPLNTYSEIPTGRCFVFRLQISL
jgi:tetratricopeptide (TPR) repeat protein